MNAAEPSGRPGVDAMRDWTPGTIYSLGFLTLISSFNYLDRSVLGLALPSIKAEMVVSDTALGLVSGLAFVLFYSFLGIPIAWLADRWNRRNIIAFGFAFWSFMTVVTGFVVNIWQLGVARFLMGAGEACGLAPSNSMISDLFRRERRPLALAFFGTASSIAFIIFFPIAGWIVEIWGWRTMFIAAGLPGMALALLFFFTVKEPPRGGKEGEQQIQIPTKSGLAETLKFLLGARTYVALLIGATLMGANAFAAGAWGPTFLARVHGLSMGEVASTLGPMRGIASLIGILAGGFLIDRLGRNDERFRLRLPAIACLLVAPAEVMFLLGEANWVWISGYALTSFFTLIHQAPIFAVALSVARLRMRAVAIAVVVFCASLVGQAAGPLMVGMLNDMLEPAYGDHAIRYSMLVLAVTAVLAALSFWYGSLTIIKDYQRTAQTS